MASGASTSSWASAEASVATPIAEAGTISGAAARFPVAITTGSYAVTLRKGATIGAMADTAVTGTITSGNDLTLSGSVAVSAGDLICWKITPTTSPDLQTYVQITCWFTATVSGNSIIFANAATGTGTQYLQPGAFNSAARTDTETRVPVPADASATSLYVTLSAAPGSGKSKTLAVYYDGVVTALTVTISDTATVGSITGQAVSLVAGHVINVVETASGGPATSAVGVCIGVTPTVPGESYMFSAFVAAQSTSAARYGNANGQTTSGDSTEANVYNLVPTGGFVAKKLFCVVSTAPAGGASRTQTLRVGSAASALTAAISGANTSNSDTTHSVTVAGGALIDFETLPAGTPAADTYLQIGFVAYVQPTATGHQKNLLTMGVG